MNDSANTLLTPIASSSRDNLLDLSGRAREWLSYYHRHPAVRFAGYGVVWTFLFYINIKSYGPTYFPGSYHGVPHAVILAVLETGQSILVFLWVRFTVFQKIIAQRKRIWILYFLLGVMLLSTFYVCIASLLFRTGVVSTPVARMQQIWVQMTQFPGGMKLMFLFALSSMFRYPLAVVPLALTIVRQLIDRTIRRAELEAETKRQELNFLRAQVSPHFLFNTLNNVFSMTLRHDPKSADTVAHLRKLMEFCLDYSQSSAIMLSQEIDFLQDYLRLERIRHGKHVSIDFQVQNSGISPETFSIPPLLLLPLVENAVKHGINQAVDHAFARFTLTLNAQGLTFVAENSVPPHTTPARNGGIGLRNLQLRLDMLYPGRHELRTDRSLDTYTATLQLRNV